MRFVVWGDVHFHPWQETERPDRWRDMLGIIPFIYEEAHQLEADYIVFLGDLFESKRHVRSDIISSVFSTLLEAGRKYEIPHRMIAGNHDLYGGACILDPLHDDELFLVYSDRVEVDSGLAYVPHGVQPDPNTEYKVAFTHTTLREGRFSGNGLVSDTSSIDEGFFAKRGGRLAAFNGHFHHPQEIKWKGCVPIHCAGSCIELNWSDADSTEERGLYLCVLGQELDMIRIPLKQYPRFYSKWHKKVRPVDFVRTSIRSEEGATATRKHKDSDLVGGDDMEASIDAYAHENYAGNWEKEEVSEVGKAIYRRRTPST